MTLQLSVDGIARYLAVTGWERDANGWRGASVWRYPGDFEVVVPSQDGMGDGERRVREILRCLSEVEDRPPDDIAQDIVRPEVDKQFFRTFPTQHESGYVSLHSGVQMIQGIRTILATAARTVLQGPHFAFLTRPPGQVGDFLRAAELGPTRAGSYIVEVRLATDVTARRPGQEDLTGRVVLVQMLEAVSAAQAAVMVDSPTAFDETVTAGVSAELCGALSNLAGSNHSEPFEITFRWARSLPLDVSSHVVAFPPRSGSLLQAADTRLRGLNASGPATVTGVIEGLSDDQVGGDRWRIKVRGNLRTEHLEGSRRAVWVRLTDHATYQRAIDAHRQGLIITVPGKFSSTTGRVELVPDRTFTI